MNKKDIDNLDWSYAFRDELHEAEFTPPKDGWERLETSLSATPLPQKRGLYTLKWVASIAATLLLGWVAADFWIGDKIVDQVTSTDELYSELESSTSISKSKQDVESIDYATKEISNEIAVRRVIEEKKIVDSKDTTTFKPLITTTTSDGVEDSNKQEGRAESQSSEEKEKSYFAYNSIAHSPVVKKNKRRTSISANVVGISNGVNPVASSFGHGSVSADGGGSCSLDNSILFTDSYVDVRGVQMYSRSEVKHRQPITFALNAERRVSDIFAFESGISYTSLISDVYFNNLSVTEVQKVHLIGIPLRANIYVYKGDFLELYAGVGGTTEYCVAATIGGQLTSEKRWHFSANAALGAQYMFNDWLGLYVEPDFSYYFSQTNLKTIRNEYPLSFNIRCGLRFKL